MAEKKPTPKSNGRTMTGQAADVIDTQPNEKSIQEVAVVTFGRFNPPTKGHQRLVETLKEVAEAVGGTPGVYLSHSSGTEKNPLDYQTRLGLCTEAFGGDVVIESMQNNIFEVLTSLSGHYDAVFVVLGEDRAEILAERLRPYLGQLFDFELLEIISVPRDEYSGTSARSFVAEGDYDSFKDCLPAKLTENASQIFGLIQQTKTKKPIAVSDRLRRYMHMQRIIQDDS